MLLPPLPPRLVSPFPLDPQVAVTAVTNLTSQQPSMRFARRVEKPRVLCCLCIFLFPLYFLFLVQATLAESGGHVGNRNFRERRKREEGERGERERERRESIAVSLSLASEIGFSLFLSSFLFPPCYFCSTILSKSNRATIESKLLYARYNVRAPQLRAEHCRGRAHNTALSFFLLAVFKAFS